MTNEEAEKILFYHRSTGNLSPMLNEALDLAISALSKQCASTEQVGKDIKFPTIHCCRGYDSIQDENGRMGFGVYDPKEKNIYIAGDVPKEIFMKALFHEIFHWMQDVAGMKFDEDDANSFSDILYDAVDMFDDHGPELFGQKAIVEPGEVFVGENVLKEALDDQFRDDTKKTDDVLINLPSAQPETNCSEIPNDSDTISRQAAIEVLRNRWLKTRNYDGIGEDIAEECEIYLKTLPSAQPEPLSDAYMNAVWTWLIDYQIKAAELKGRYTPYEVLSWVVNDWRKEHEGSD